MDYCLKIPLTAATVKDESRKTWLEIGYIESEFQTIANHFDGRREFMDSPITGHAIVNAIGVLVKVQLTFETWADGNIYARDDKNRRHVIIGSWSGNRYFARGLVRQRRKVGKFAWQINGQASTGTIQVEHFGEENPFTFEALENEEKEYLAMVEASAERRRIKFEERKKNNFR
jgi:hypothetical protein